MKKFGLGNAIKTRFTFAELQKLFSTIREEGSHWIWTGGKNCFGYGHAWWRGQWCYAHRLFYAAFRGFLSFGDDVHHIKRCQVKLCCNPFHLKKLPHVEHARAHNGKDLPF